jgi:oligosaccharide repeat unit polymerase
VIIYHFFPLLALKFASNYFEINTLVDSDKINISVLIWSLSFILVVNIFGSKAKETKDSFSLKGIILIQIFTNLFSCIIIYNNIVSYFLLKNFGYLAVYNYSKDFLIKNTTILPIHIFLGSALFVYYIKKSIDIKRSIFLKFTIFFYFFSMFSYVFFGGRSGFFYFVIINLIIFYSNKIVPFTKLVLASCGLFLFMIFIGIQRDGVSVDSNQTYIQRAIFELSQTVFVFNNSLEIIKIDFERYISLLLTFVPNTLIKFTGFEPPLNLSQLYVNLTDPSLSNLGGGYGFSILAEFYLIGGMVGIFLGSIVFSLFSLKIDKVFSTNSMTDIGLYSVFSYYLLMSPRGELGDLYRPFIFALVLYLFIRIKVSTK